MSEVVEVGSLRGRSSYALLTGCPGTVYCVDPFNDDDGNTCLEAHGENCGHFPNLVTVVGKSPAIAADERFQGGVDMVFLDGDHSYDQVIADIAAWYPLTRRLLCGHDYDFEAGFPGVKQAVNEVFGDRVSVPAETGIWCVEI